MKKLIALIFVLGICITVSATETSEIESHSNGYNFTETVERVKSGELKFDVAKIFNNIIDKLIGSLKQNYSVAITLIVVSIFSAIAENIEVSFNSKSNITFFVFFVVIIIYGIGVFKNSLNLAIDTLDNLILFVNALYPVMLTTIASGGMVTAATTLHPVLMMCGGFVMMIIKSVIFPVFSVGVALKIANVFSEDLQSGRLSKLIDGFIKWTIGIMMTLFVGIVTVTGVTAPNIDSVSIRATKFAIGSFIPMVGNVISDSFDIIMNSSSVIKGSIGIAGLFNILFICFTPCVMLASVSLMFNICAVFSEPVCNKRIVELIEVFSKAVFTLFGILCASSCMFVLCTGVLVGIKAV